MTTRLNEPVDYYLSLDENELHLNPYIGKKIQLIFQGNIQCSHCGRATRKSFSQGFCYPCFQKLPQCDLCMMSPDRCHYDQGTCRDSAWGDEVCMQSHIVYLANSTGVKVGITKVNQIPTRWIDQGAKQGLPILRVATRQISGLAEMIFKAHVSDRTHWQKMLKSEGDDVDLMKVRDELMLEVAPELAELTERFGLHSLMPVTDVAVQSIQYPINQYPTKVVSLNFDKTPSVEGVLLGIKGQYLILDIGVINLRKFGSYEVEFSGED